ncbi:hypothetical protein MRX96_048395 [Rhipicephalus microplus]
MLIFDHVCTGLGSKEVIVSEPPPTYSTDVVSPFKFEEAYTGVTAGGPVEIWKGNKAYQVGIISFPKSCDASRDIPSAHERVDYYFEWIKTVIAYYHKWTWHPPDPAPAKPHDH